MKYFKVINIIIFAFSLIAGCNDDFEYVYQPANPPVGLKLKKTASGHHLTFQSENQTNDWFGGFLIFAEPTEDVLTREVYLDGMSQESQNKVIKEFLDMAETIAFKSLPDSISPKKDFIHYEHYSPLSGKEFNRGIDKKICVSFSTTDSTGDACGLDNIVIDAVIGKDTTNDKIDKITPGNFLTLRTYLINEDKKIIRISSPGNIIDITDDTNTISTRKGK